MTEHYTPPTREQISAMMKEGAAIGAQIMGDGTRATADVWLVATSAIAALLCGYRDSFERAGAADRLAVGSLALSQHLDAIAAATAGTGEARQ